MIPALGAGPEFDRIRAIAQALGERASGLGDDCALIPMGDEFLAVSTDIAIERVHFRRDWLSPEEIGWRAAAGALSDLAAAGADPIGVLASLALPSDSPIPDSVALMEGVARATDAVGGKVLGGNLARSPVWTIGVTVIGRTRAPVRRTGAQVSDGIWVTGRLGGARAALLALEAGQTPGSAIGAAFAHPLPRIAAGRWLAQHGVRAMIDVSDGLSGDAQHLSVASGVALAIELEQLPLEVGVKEMAEASGEDPFIFAARGGEDYELLAAMPRDFSAQQASLFEQETGLPLTRIGTAEAGTGVELSREGRTVSLGGFNHFR